MKKVLVALDILRSGGCGNCIKTARKIADAFEAQLIFLHVLSPFPGFVSAEIPSGVHKKRLSQAREELRKLAAHDESCGVVVREGAPAAIILEHASEIGADLIVLDSHDPDLTNYFLGSVASRVVRHAHCSVHIVRRPVERIQE